MSKEEIIAKYLQVLREEYGKYDENNLRKINFFTLDDIETALEALTK